MIAAAAAKKVAIATIFCCSTFLCAAAAAKINAAADKRITADNVKFTAVKLRYITNAFAPDRDARAFRFFI